VAAEATGPDGGGATGPPTVSELPGPGGSTVRKTTGRLADGRAIRYYDRPGAPARDAPDRRPLAAQDASSQIRHDPLLDASVIIAAQRQDRSYHPSPEDCPLDPSRPGHPTEIPSADYEVVVFENRFAALSAPALFGGAPLVDGLFAEHPGVGRCEVVCFTSEHAASFADLSPERVGTVVTAWRDRTAELGALPEVAQVFCFENRGAEIGVTLEHPHGQIYAYPFVTPRTGRVLASVAAYRAGVGRNLFDDVVAAELAAGVRVVAADEHWVAFVPHAARWPYEVHLYPTRRVPDMTALDDDQLVGLAPIYLELLARFDRLFDGGPTPYIAAWHQAPRGATEDFALHLELFTVRRAPGRLKYLAGSESGMDAFANDVVPEVAAERLRASLPVTG
jgi:UDPglucose--hexose-1-phosphate uridylyltransferase